VAVPIVEEHVAAIANGASDNTSSISNRETLSPSCRQTPELDLNNAFLEYAVDAKVEVEESALDKTACYAAAKEVSRSLIFFDVTPALVVWYGARPPGHAYEIPHFLASRMCAGNQRYESTLRSTMEIVAVSAASTVRMQVGEFWVTDGTTVTTLTPAQYAVMAKKLAGRRTQGVGHAANSSRAEFEKRVADKTYNRHVAEREA
jgi:hypothetical protein